jgi:hypothetical protein
MYVCMYVCMWVVYVYNILVYHSLLLKPPVSSTTGPAAGLLSKKSTEESLEPYNHQPSQ